jgi:hypothetical protein
LYGKDNGSGKVVGRNVIGKEAVGKEAVGKETRRDAALFGAVSQAGEAEEHLRVIRQAMVRSTKHSTLSGLSGVLAGFYALAASFLAPVAGDGTPLWQLKFVLVWGVTLALALGTDIVLTKRRAANVGKSPFSPLALHLTRAVAPGLLAGVSVTLFHLTRPDALGPYIYGLWMLCYGVSLLAIGMFSVREVSVLGWAFLAAGAVAMLLPTPFYFGPRALMALTFGGFHIGYGIRMGIKHGW